MPLAIKCSKQVTQIKSGQKKTSVTHRWRIFSSFIWSNAFSLLSLFFFFLFPPAAFNLTPRCTSGSVDSAKPGSSYPPTPIPIPPHPTPPNTTKLPQYLHHVHAKWSLQWSLISPLFRSFSLASSPSGPVKKKGEGETFPLARYSGAEHLRGACYVERDIMRYKSLWN